MSLTQSIALYLGTAWASGLNLYATILVLGTLEHSGYFHLPPALAIAANPWVMGAAGVLYITEFVADKIPWVDSAWDAIHTFIRIPAGVLLAVGALQPLDPVPQAVAVLVAGALAAGSHGTKMSTRLALNLSPEPVTNWTASLLEDALAVGGLLLVAFFPLAFFVLLAATIIAATYFVPKLWRAFSGGIAYARARWQRH
jgi:hypothetical protein